MKRIADAAGKGTWQASAWLLERTRPEKYALIKRVETGPPGSFDSLNDKELTAAILELVPQRPRSREDARPRRKPQPPDDAGPDIAS